MKIENLIRIGSLFIIASFLVGFSCYAQQSNEEDFLKKGKEYVQSGKKDEAIAEFNKAIEINPNNAEAYCNRGFVYTLKGNADQAILDFNKAIEINPNDVTSYMGRGMAYAKTGNLDKAIFDLTKTVEISPNDPKVYAARAPIYLMKKDYDKSWADVHKAESLGYKIRPDVIDALKKASGKEKIGNNLTQVSIPKNEMPMYGNLPRTEQEKEADAEFIKTVITQNGSKEAAVKQSLGYAWDYVGKGDLKIAMRRFNQTWLLDPNNAQVYYGFGTILKKEGKFDEAIKMFDMAIEIKLDFWEAYNDRGNSYKNKGDFDRAISDFSKCLQINPNSSLAHYNRGLVLHTQRQWDQAILDFTKVIEMDPNDGEVCYERACAYLYKKEYDKSWKDVNRAIELGYKVDPGFLSALKKSSGREK